MSQVMKIMVELGKAKLGYEIEHRMHERQHEGTRALLPLFHAFTLTALLITMHNEGGKRGGNSKEDNRDEGNWQHRCATSTGTHSFRMKCSKAQVSHLISFFCYLQVKMYKNNSNIQI